MCSALSSPTSDTGRASRKGAVLCVDDSPNMLLICRTILEASGYDVFTAADGKTGLETLQQHTIDAVVVDNKMPGMNGMELAQEIKQAYRTMPVVMFSDSSEEPASLSYIDLFLNKKIGPRALRDAISSLLAKRRI